MSGPADWMVAWAVEAVIASSLLMALVLLIRGPAQRAVGPQLAYWLWALPLLRMLLPPLPAVWRQAAALPLTTASETVLVFLDPLAATPGAAAGSSLALLIGALWLVGAALFFAWHGLAHARYVARIVSPPAQHSALAGGMTLVASDAATGPVAFGVFRRFVAVPRDFAERYDADERALALAHELGHHARGDLIANWFALGVLALHWFNPLAWAAYRKFRIDQEMANDARVLAALPAVQRHAYACAIVKAAHGRAVTAACHLHTIDDLKGRLRMLKTDRKSRRVLLVGATGIAALTVAGLGLTASGAAAERLRIATGAALPPLAALATVQATVVPAPPPPAVPTSTLVPQEKRVKRVVVVRDGKTDQYEGAAADAFLAANPKLLPPPPPAVPGDRKIAWSYTGTGAPPEVVTMTCGGKTTDGRSNFVIADQGKAGKRITICSDRIESMASTTTAQGFAASRYATISAMQGLRQGRAAIVANQALSEDQRKLALDGIDTAMKSLEQDLSPVR